MLLKRWLFTLIIYSLIAASPGAAAEKKETSKVEITSASTPILWRSPTDLAGRDLRYGPGGPEHQPQGEFTFVEEDTKGSNPKYVLRDSDGVKWKAKLGAEARSETVATRLVWAAGYFADEDYFVTDIHVKNIPPKLHHGGKLIGPGGTMRNVRMERDRKGEKKIGNWTWRDNPFVGARELNGLRVLMAMLNNWDLKDVNNAILQTDGEQIYLVSDLGASFGAPGFAWPTRESRDNLEAYKRSKLIRRTTPEYVDFTTPGRPALIRWVDPYHFVKRLKLRWIGKQIPREHAKWIGESLARLTPKQIRSAFEAAGYSSAEVEEFARAVEGRIAQLNEL